jgi:hypothetical protein
LKRKQQEENKDKTDYLFSYGSLLMNKKVGGGATKNVWKNNLPPSSKSVKATGFHNTSNQTTPKINDTPKDGNKLKYLIKNNK